MPVEVDAPPTPRLDETTEGEWLSLAEAAQRLGLAPDTVRRRLKRGELPSRRVVTPQGYCWQVRLPRAQATDTEPSRPHVDAAQASDLGALIRDLTGQVALLSGQVGFLQGQLAAARERVAQLEAPAAGSGAARPWWMFWRL
jgi:excisionase family DNA binding protein